MIDRLSHISSPHIAGLPPLEPALQGSPPNLNFSELLTLRFTPHLPRLPARGFKPAGVDEI